MGHESECHKCGMAFTMSKYDCEPKKILDGPGPLGLSAEDTAFIMTGVRQASSRDPIARAKAEYGDYRRLHALQELDGDRAIADLEDACFNSSPVPACYADLFKLYRKRNKAAMENSRFDDVYERILKMIELDAKMLDEIWAGWGSRQKSNRKKIDSAYTKLTITDLRYLEKCAETLKDAKKMKLSKGARRLFKQRKGK